jgi:non-heme Fe2+,alpha-ketoglutarate-dependent halogenase
MFGGDEKGVVEKYNRIFAEFPLPTKIKVLIKTLVTLLVIQVPYVLFKLRILRAPVMQDNQEVDLRAYAYKRDRENGPGEFFLQEKEIDFFNDNGYIPPFKVVSREEALALNPVIREKVMSGNIVYGPFPDMDHDERKIKMDKAGLRDDIEARSWNRHFNVPEIYGLFARNEITHRLASLFGDDVVLWRSQLFPVSSGGKGTALHQVTDFRFAMNKVVLQPKVDVPKSLINLTVWMALNDVDETNGAMILIAGSHKNNRFEQYGINIKYYLTQLALRDQWQMLFVRSVSNDAHARFDLMNLYRKNVEKLDSTLFPEDRFRTIRMRAGEAIIFTSRTTHGSHGNTAQHERLALGGRLTTPKVGVYPEKGEYKEVNHFQPLTPVLLDKYKKTFPLFSLSKQKSEDEKALKKDEKAMKTVG